MAKLDLDALEARARAATPGRWLLPFDDGALVAADRPRDSLLSVDKDGMGVVDRRADAEHIAGLSPDVVLALVAELRALRRIERMVRGAYACDHYATLGAALAALDEVRRG